MRLLSVRIESHSVSSFQRIAHGIYTQSPQLILAGAGTGKTTTITAKIAYMVEKENIDPSHILALTFSKEAARNMREKVEKLLQGKEVIVKTFHSFCAELIKDHADRCKVPGDFKIFEEMESAIFIFRELGLTYFHFEYFQSLNLHPKSIHYRSVNVQVYTTSSPHLSPQLMYSLTSCLPLILLSQHYFSLEQSQANFSF